jgi:hypothetical protein
VSFRLVDDDIVFHAPAGAGQDALDGTVIAFEADAFDQSDGNGWSVLVVGRVEPDTEPGLTRVQSARISGHRFR